MELLKQRGVSASRRLFSCGASLRRRVGGLVTKEARLQGGVEAGVSSNRLRTTGSRVTSVGKRLGGLQQRMGLYRSVTRESGIVRRGLRRVRARRRGRREGRGSHCRRQ